MAKFNKKVLFISIIMLIILSIFRDITFQPIKKYPTIKLGDPKYDIIAVNSPIIDGFKLKIMSQILNNKYFSQIIKRSLLNKNNIHIIRELASQIDNTYPILYTPIKILSKKEFDKHNKCYKYDDNKYYLKQGLFCNNHEIKCFDYKLNTSQKSIEDQHNAYKNNKIKPSDVIKQIFSEIERLQPTLKMFSTLMQNDSMAQALLADERYKSGNYISVFDGVPVGVKDEFNIKGYETTHGTEKRFGHKEKYDDMLVERLKSSGAIIIGLTSMVEYGLSPIAFNSHIKGPINPHKLNQLTGGSSSGSAVAVAAGLVPIAIGSDGGGSIRIPASLTGVYGIANTYTRVPVSRNSNSVTKHGVLAGTARDLCLSHLLLSRPSKNHQQNEMYGKLPPNVYLDGVFKTKNLNGLKIGIFREWFNDSKIEIVNACQKMLNILKENGAEIIEINIPHLHQMRMSHGLIISSEISFIHDLNHDNDFIEIPTTFNLGIGRSFSALEFIAASKLKSWTRRQFNNLYKKVDVIITPTVPETATEISSGEYSYGKNDVNRSMRMMKYIFLANYIGNPAINIPININDDKLPIGLHFMADHWKEDILLKLAIFIENVRNGKVDKPEQFADLKF